MDMFSTPKATISFDNQNQTIQNGPKDEVVMKLETGSCVCDEKCKRVINLLVLGITGAGKTTFLDSFCNFLLGVKFKDGKRYKLVEEKNKGAASTTSEVTIYHIGWRSIESNTDGDKICINIIDTPGFADTRGHRWDCKIQIMIQSLIMKFDSLDYICLAIK